MGKQSRKKWLNREIKTQRSSLKSKRWKKFFKISILVVLLMALGVGGYYGWKKYYKKNTPPPAVNSEQESQNNKIAVIETNKGTIKVELYPDVAPKTVDNFVKLVNEGFYNGTKFHRVIADFMIQGGDPTSRDDSQKDNWGTGDPGYKFDDEINPWGIDVDSSAIQILQNQGYTYNKDLKSMKNLAGVIAMANSGPNTNGSQFFIITRDPQPQLDGKHTVFGKVIEGMDVVLTIAEVGVDEKNRPLEDVVINKIEITKAAEEIKKDEAIKIETIPQEGTNNQIQVEDIQTEPAK